MIMRTAAASVALLFCAARSLGAQVTANAAVDRIFAEWDKPDSPGCAVGAIQNNRYLYKRGYGMANLDYDIPNAAEMVYSIGSDSKQFTAASVALLSMQGKLSLDDDLRKYVPELPGQPLREFADAQIFTPLGMTHTHFHDDPGHIRKQRAMRYEKEGQGGFRISYLQNFDKVGAGGLYSTINDLRKWDENFSTHQVGGDALQAIMHTRGVLNSADDV